jgi:hypothetical protein
VANDGPFHNFVGLTTDVFVLLREMFVVALCCLVLFAPVAFKTVLTRVGISKVPTPFGDIEVKDAGNTVSALNRGLADTILRLQQIQEAPSEPDRKQGIQGVMDYLHSLQQQAQVTDDSIKTNLVTQQAVLEQTSPQSAQMSGWLFLGHINKSNGSNQLRWFGEGAKNVAATLSPTLTVGERFIVTSPAYLHEDAPSGSHFGGKVTGVVPMGGQVEVLAPPEFSPAIAGGSFLWAKVKRLQ